ncbi:peptidoglycan-binding domain-containing protein [Streptomyces adelaidensis]|uniref:peptidoglycan-binding domain-containing protein n=1 Tax=Streptomyces adelaidensis TaxID=2796465 RepID=UPI0019074277|nr:peptidoglycan-binding domain-containing protein [Streptomyces adelaidensis]
MSIPPEPGQTAKRPTIEPTYVIRRRRTEALAELLREMELHKGTTDANDEYETVAVPPMPDPTPPPPPARERILPRTEYETEELPPFMVGEDFGADTVQSGGRRQRRRPARGDGPGLKRAAVVVGVGAAALIGFGAALLLPGGDTEKEAKTVTPATSAPATSAPPRNDAADSDAADPDGAGTLREGDTGAEVLELQRRLLRIPNVYDNGSTSGQYDAVLKEAVARFQLWYGIRGDETGVYGDDTRQDLESRTTR